MTRFLLLAAFGLFLTACDSTSETPPDLTVRTVADVAADPAERDPATGQTMGTDQYTLVSLRVQDDTTTAADERIILSSSDEVRTDSASTQWDIGFRGSDIILNGGTSGPGAAVGVVVEEAFQDVDDALSYTLRRDGEAECPAIETPAGPQPGTSRAVCGGSDNGWYTYVPFPGGRGGYLVPTPGRTLVVRLANNQGYAKINFQSYYQGAPEPSTITASSPSRFYTFDYVVTDETGSFVADAMM